MKKKQDSIDEELEIITLELDNNKTLDCQILTILNVEGQDYIYLLPSDNCEMTDEGEFFIYKYFENENEEITLDNNLTDEEFDMAADAFDALLDEQEYFEYIDDDNDI